METVTETTTITLTDSQVDVMSFALRSLFDVETTVMEPEFTSRELTDQEVLEHIARHRELARISAMLSDDLADNWNELADACATLPKRIRHHGAYSA